MNDTQKFFLIATAIITFGILAERYLESRPVAEQAEKEGYNRCIQEIMQK